MIENTLPEGNLPSPEVGTSAPDQSEQTIAKPYAADLVKDGWKRGHKKGFDAGYQRALEEFKSSPVPSMDAAPMPNNGYAAPQTMQQPNSSQFVTVDYLQQMERDRQARERQQQEISHGQRIMSEMESKKTAARQELPDYDKNAFDLDVMDPTDAQVYVALNNAPGEHGAHLLYDMGKNPHRYAAVAALAKKPAQLQKYLKEWGDSLQQNKEASKTNFPPEPIGQIKSNLTMTDNGKKSGDRHNSTRYRWE